MTTLLIIAAVLLLVYAFTAAWLWYGFRKRFSL